MQTQIFRNNGAYQIRSRARSHLDEQAVSDWSDTLQVTVRGCKITTDVVPEGAGIIDIAPNKPDYDFGETLQLTAISLPGYQFQQWNPEPDSVLRHRITIFSDTALVAIFQLVSVIYNNQAGTPSEYALDQNYPNPFNSKTAIQYQLPEESHVKIFIFNISGQIVTSLIDKLQEPGYYQVLWDGTGFGGTSLSSGLYWCVLETINQRFSKKMLILR